MLNNEIQFTPVSTDTIDFEPIAFEPIDSYPDYKQRDTSLLSKYNTLTRDIFEGATKEAERGSKSLGKLGNFILSQTVGRGVSALAGKGFTPTKTPDVYDDTSQFSIDFIDRTTPANFGQKLGAIGFKVGEFILADKIVKPISKVKTGYKSLNLALRSMAGATSTGGATTLQTGKFGREAKINAFIGALIPVAVEGMKTLSTRINKAVIKPSTKDYADGFRAETINKYKLGGSLQRMSQNTGNEIKTTAEKLRDVLTSSDEQVDLNGVYYKTYDKLKGKQFRLFGQNRAVDRVLGQLADELDNVTGVRDGVNLYEANLIKQGAGAKGSWSFGNPDPDATAVEKVYNTFYNVLKTTIEKAGGSKIVQALNGKLGELIPVQNAILRRIPVAERQAVIGLQDSMYLFGALLDPRSLFLNLGTIATKSPIFANWLYKAATGSLKGVPSTTIKTAVSEL